MPAAPVTARVEHVGSLLRPMALRKERERLLGVHDANQNLGAHDNAELRKIEDGYIKQVVKLQEDAGVKVVTDGEFRRRSWWSDFYLSLKGTKVTYNGKMPITFVNAAGEKRPAPGMTINGKVSWSGSVNVDGFRYLKSVTKVTPKVSLPAPPMLHFMRDEIDAKTYPDMDKLFADIVTAYQAEIAALAGAGCRYVQLDECMMPFLCDPRHRELSRQRGEDPDMLIGKYAEVINEAMAKRPSDMTFAVHMCRGNLNAFWGAEGGYDPVSAAMFGKISADRYLLEYDTPRAGDFKPLADLPKGRRVLLGLVSTKDPKLESADALKRRIDEAAKFVPLDQIGICPQCGFSTNMFGTSFTEDDEKRKLELLVKVATDVWGTA